MNFSERLNAFFKATGIKKNDLPESIGISRGMLFNYLAGRNEPSAAFFQNLKKAFPWVNIEWLITGVGEMMSRENRGISQVATGNGHVLVGGRISTGKNVRIGGVHAGRDVIESNTPVSAGKGGLLAVEDLIRVLSDYVSPKILEEIKKRLDIK